MFEVETEKLKMIKNDWDWKVRFGEFEIVGTEYSIELGHTRGLSGFEPDKTVYIRLWQGDYLVVGASLATFRDPAKFEPYPSTIRERIESLPPDVYSFCIKLAERFNNLRAFA